ncbi:MAG: methyltransferase domain-containing protein [Clostridia bacterium]|nr:methyltransferase domain-containing protein [Clostridia bacterium]
MTEYDIFSRFYDELTENVEYKKRAEYVNRLIKENCPDAEIVVDLACGTGSLTVELAGMGYEMIGVDCSVQMLSEAQNKAYDSDGNIMFLCQRMQELDLYGTVDAVVCMLDSINHITDEAEVQQVFNKVSLFMNKGGVFIFDVNTPYKHKEILGNNTFVYETEEVFCVWQNELEDDESTVNITLNFFEKDEDVYYREEENFSEKAYDTEKLLDMLKESGMSVVSVFDEMTNEIPHEKSERIFIVAKKD